MPPRTQVKYPTFIWIVAGFVILLLALYSVKKGEVLKKLVFPGGSAEFGPAPKPDIVTFRVSYNLPRSPAGPALQGQATIYIGESATNLRVDQASPFATSIVKIQKGSGTALDEYGYRLEITEIWPASDSTPYNYRIDKSTEGKLTIKDGDGFKVQIGTAMYVETREYERKAMITKVLSEKEERENVEEFLKETDKMKDIPNKPYTPKQ